MPTWKAARGLTTVGAATGVPALATVMYGTATCCTRAAWRREPFAASTATVRRVGRALYQHVVHEAVLPGRRGIHMTSSASGHRKPKHEHVLQFPSFREVKYEKMYPPTRSPPDRGLEGKPPKPDEHWWLDNAGKTGYAEPFRPPRKAPPIADPVAKSRAKSWKSEFRVLESDILGKSNKELLAPLRKRIPCFSGSKFTQDPTYSEDPLLQYWNTMTAVRNKYTRELAVANQALEQEAARKKGRIGALLNPAEALRPEVEGRFLPEGTELKPTPRDKLEPIEVTGVYDAWRSTACNATFKLSDGSIYRHDILDTPTTASGSPKGLGYKNVANIAGSLIDRAGNPGTDANTFRLTPKGGDFVRMPQWVIDEGRRQLRRKREFRASRNRVDCLLQLYHEAENFITKENLDEKIEEFYADVSHADGTSIAELLLADEGTSKDFVPAKVVERPRTLLDFLEDTMLGGKISGCGIKPVGSGLSMKPDQNTAQLAI